MPRYPDDCIKVDQGGTYLIPYRFKITGLCTLVIPIEVGKQWRYGIDFGFQHSMTRYFDTVEQMNHYLESDLEFNL